MMQIPQQYTSLQHLHTITWIEIFAVWRAYEAYQKSWEQHWIERGFASWDAWRKSYVAPLHAEERQWNVYRIMDPLRDVAQIYGVPSRGWQEKCYDGMSTKMIGDILVHPLVKNNPKMYDMEKNFPYQTMLTGVINDNRIVLVEGMHRACVLARMRERCGDVTIALATYDGDLPSIGKGDRDKEHNMHKHP